MIRSSAQLIGRTVVARDATIGCVDDLLLEESTGMVRYAVVNTRGHLSGDRVLVSPAAFAPPAVAREDIRADMEADRIREAPPLDTDAPISRRYEISLAEHHGWPSYWIGLPENVIPGMPPPIPRSPVDEGEETGEGPHLRSARAMIGYNIEGNDRAALGHLHEVLIDCDHWYWRHLVLDTSHWHPGRKIVIDRRWLTSISYRRESISLDLSEDQMRRGPEYDPQATEIVGLDELYSGNP